MSIDTEHDEIAHFKKWQKCGLFESFIKKHTFLIQNLHFWRKSKILKKAKMILCFSLNYCQSTFKPLTKLKNWSKFQQKLRCKTLRANLLIWGISKIDSSKCYLTIIGHHRKANHFVSYLLGLLISWRDRRSSQLGSCKPQLSLSLVPSGYQRA